MGGMAGPESALRQELWPRPLEAPASHHSYWLSHVSCGMLEALIDSKASFP